MNYIEVYPESAIIYILILIICLTFAILASNKKNINRKSNIWITLIIITLTIFAGIRGKTVGIDVQHYIIRHIEPIREGLIANVNQPIGFKLIIWIVYRFTSETYLVFTFFAFITNGLIVKRLWDFRERASFSMMIFFYYSYYYLITFNVFRQFMPIAIIFWGTRYLEKKKYFKFGVILLIAMSIHETAILGAILIPIDIILSKENSKQRKLRNILLLTAPIVGSLALILLLKFFDFEHYIRLYEIYNKSGLGIMVPMKILMGSATYIILKNDSLKMKNDEIIEIKKIWIVYCIGLIMSLAIVLSNFADRFAWYFLIWEPIFMALKIKNRDLNLIIKSIYIFFAVYTLYIGLSGSGQGIMPYITIWNH